jgi:hypothetical protein
MPDNLAFTRLLDVPRLVIKNKLRDSCKLTKRLKSGEKFSKFSTARLFDYQYEKPELNFHTPRALLTESGLKLGTAFRETGIFKTNGI